MIDQIQGTEGENQHCISYQSSFNSLLKIKENNRNIQKMLIKLLKKHHEIAFNKIKLCCGV